MMRAKQADRIRTGGLIRGGGGGVGGGIRICPLFFFTEQTESKPNIFVCHRFLL